MRIEDVNLLDRFDVDQPGQTLARMTRETLVDVEAPQGKMATYVYEPDGAVKGLIVLYMDAAGVRSELRDMATRLAAGRYLVLLPDLYHRLGRLVSFDAKAAGRDPAQLQEIIRHIRSVTNEYAMADTRALFAWAKGAAVAAELPVGTLGYCMGGPFAFAAASCFPELVRAAASIYGVGCMTERADSPHRDVARIRAELYFAYAERDQHAPITEVAPLARVLGAAGLKYQVEVYPGVDHGFAFAEREAYDRSASERHWERVSSLFQRNLG